MFLSRLDMLSRSVAFGASARASWPRGMAEGTMAPNFFAVVGISEIFMLRWNIFRHLLLLKTKVSSFIRKSLKLPPLLYRYHDTPKRVICSIGPREIFLKM